MMTLWWFIVVFFVVFSDLFEYTVIHIFINSWPLFTKYEISTILTAGATAILNTKHYSIFLGVVKVKVGRGSWDFGGKEGSRARCWGS